MAQQQNPRLTDGWWIVKGRDDWGRGLGVLTDGWWFPECLPLDIIRLNLKVGIDPHFGASIMDEIKINLGILKTLLNVPAEICKEKEENLQINKEEDISVGICTEIELDAEG